MSTKSITVKLIKGLAGCSKRQKETVKGLGLGKLNSVRVVVDHPATRGMVAKVPHLVRIILEA